MMLAAAPAEVMHSPSHRRQLCSVVASVRLWPLCAAGNVTDGAQKCYYCPVGSVAKDATNAVGQTGSITCTVW